MACGAADFLGPEISPNLIENALRHTPLGSRIEIGLAGKGSEIVLTAADDGPGVPAPEREKVLRRLYRLERSRTTPGHGLGLSLVAAIADLHRVKLMLEDNQPGLRVRLAFTNATVTSSNA